MPADSWRGQQSSQAGCQQTASESMITSQLLSTTRSHALKDEWRTASVETLQQEITRRLQDSDAQTINVLIDDHTQS